MRITYQVGQRQGRRLGQELINGQPNELGWFTAGFHHPGFLPRFLDRAAHFELEPEKRLAHLSKGQYAKVGLALALAHEPEVLILDEPTSGLDVLVRREFLEHMAGLAAEGRTILISDPAERASRKRRPTL